MNGIGEGDAAMTLGVGIIGCGGATQAIHLPTLARLSDTFRIAHVMDVAPAVAEAVATRVGARWSTTVEEVLADDDVEVVLICSPPSLHAEQVRVACTAGVRAVLCEKPLAETVEQAESVAAVCRETGTPLLVGTMHAFDPAWTRARERWGDLVETAHSLRLGIVLPPNAIFEEAATEIVRPPAAPPPETKPDADAKARGMRDLVLGLHVHDLPLIREFLGQLAEVEAAEFTASGILISIVGRNGRHAQMLVSSSAWRPDWTLEVWSDETALRVEFPPSFVHAGSGTAQLAGADGVGTLPGSSRNGYEEEWTIVAELAERGESPRAPSLDTLIDDLSFAIAVANGAADRIREHA